MIWVIGGCIVVSAIAAAVLAALWVSIDNDREDYEKLREDFYK